MANNLRTLEAELRNIANRLARQSNDPQALADFTNFVQRLSRDERLDLAAVLQQMIAEAKKAVL